MNKITAWCNGFIRVVASPGPDTVRIKIQRALEGNEITFALSPSECAELALFLKQYVKETNDV